MADTYKWIYDAEGGSAWITGLEGEAPEELAIPEFVDGQRVTALGQYPHRYERMDYDVHRGEMYSRTEVETKTCALSGMERVKRLCLPSTLRQMAKEVFDGMNALRHVEASGPHFNVEAGCLYDFTGVLYGVFTEEGEVKLPSRVEKILPRAFRFSPSVKRVILTRNVRLEEGGFVSAGPFTGSKVREVVFPNGMTSISAFFKDYDGIEHFEIPASVTTTSSLFDGCASLQAVTLHEGIVTLGNRTFSGCKGLESICLPNTLKTLEDEVFAYSGLVSVVLPESVTSIGKKAFCSCCSLKEAILPKNASLGWEAFRHCESLERVTLPETLSQIESYTFEGCFGLEEIVIPDGVRTVSKNAFRGCSSLKRVRLPRELKTLGEKAFYGCRALESIVLPRGVEWIYEYALPLKRVFFEGSAEEYKRIHISYCNCENVFFYAGEKPVAEGKFWHYADGEPTVWGE